MPDALSSTIDCGLPILSVAAGPAPGKNFHEPFSAAERRLAVSRASQCRIRIAVSPPLLHLPATLRSAALFPWDASAENFLYEFGWYPNPIPIRAGANHGTHWLLAHNPVPVAIAHVPVQGDASDTTHSREAAPPNLTVLGNQD